MKKRRKARRRHPGDGKPHGGRTGQGCGGSSVLDRSCVACGARRGSCGAGAWRHRGSWAENMCGLREGPGCAKVPGSREPPIELERWRERHHFRISRGAGGGGPALGRPAPRRADPPSTARAPRPPRLRVADRVSPPPPPRASRALLARHAGSGSRLRAPSMAGAGVWQRPGSPRTRRPLVT